MKKIVISMCALGMFFGLLNSGMAVTDVTDGCYICDIPNHYVQFKGKDSKELQDKALKKFGCSVYGVMPYCNGLTDADGLTRIEGVVD
ncbi:MAG TPA: hypothetical protein PK573_04935 [Spirochaetota bacterium]|nr:hypothetical protein [Spirochaetota bacterium]HRZ28751.1 hypothetical protein [Spirochaetota bacterium]HSA15363.1 hypothetical protein [Spirochaetota bacterium]